MNIDHLRSFVAVAERQNFTQAAEELFLAQPVVSRHIAALEKELSLQLFERTTRSVRITPEGRALAEGAQRALEELDGAVSRAQALHAAQSEQLRIGYSYLYMDTLTTPWITEFREEVPNVAIVESTPTALTSDLRLGKLDAIFLGTTDFGVFPPHTRTILLAEVDEKIVVGKNHPFADRVFLAVDDLRGETFAYPFTSPTAISSPVIQELSENGYEVPLLKSEFDSSALKFVEMGDAIIDLPTICQVGSSDVVEVPFKSKYRIRYYLAWLPSNKKPALKKLVDLVEEKTRALHEHETTPPSGPAPLS